MSLVPASNFRIYRTERGIRLSRTISLRTTGSVEARTAPPMKAINQGKPSRRAKATAPSPMMIPVPGPNIKAGTSHPLPSSTICNLTASRNRTSAKVKVAITSKRGLWGPDVYGSQAAAAEQEAQSEEHHRERQRRTLNQPRRQGTDRQDDGYNTHDQYEIRHAAPCSAGYSSGCLRFTSTGGRAGFCLCLVVGQLRLSNAEQLSYAGQPRSLSKQHSGYRDKGAESFIGRALVVGHHLAFSLGQYLQHVVDR